MSYVNASIFLWFCYLFLFEQETVAILGFTTLKLSPAWAGFSFSCHTVFFFEIPLEICKTGENEWAFKHQSTGWGPSPQEGGTTRHLHCSGATVSILQVSHQQRSKSCGFWSCNVWSTIDRWVVYRGKWLLQLYHNGVTEICCYQKTLETLTG